MIERARSFECELQEIGASSEHAVVIQFELAAGCYATSFLYEMCGGDSA
jgi:tRNA(Glu) U13 pseudouridine synthase TruD